MWSTFQCVLALTIKWSMSTCIHNTLYHYRASQIHDMKTLSCMTRKSPCNHRAVWVGSTCWMTFHDSFKIQLSMAMRAGPILATTSGLSVKISGISILSSRSHYKRGASLQLRNTCALRIAFARHVTPTIQASISALIIEDQGFYSYNL